MHRTHTCGELRKEHIDSKITLSGWVHKFRDHGGVLFIDLRDRYGISQIVFNPGSDHFNMAESLRREDVIQVVGKIRQRPEGTINPNMPTGEVELVSEQLKIFSKSKEIPVLIDEADFNENTRMKYQHLYLRSPSVQKKFIFKNKIASIIRNNLLEQDFLEIETPILIKSTPEGARDYVVPSRVHPGKVYSLPQSPQLYKQILMVGGMDKYFQFARCLRDEDLRSDRQPEFTQIDLEMSFVEQEDVLNLIENMIKEVCENINIDIDKIPRISYAESMNTYGSDKPDLRNPLKINDVTNILKKSSFKPFETAQTIKAIKTSGLSGKQTRNIEKEMQKNGTPIAWIQIDEELKGPVVKFLDEDLKKELLESLDGKKEEVIFLIAGEWETTCENAGKLRELLPHTKEKGYKFLWVTDYPLFHYDSSQNIWEPMHHVFSKPTQDTEKFLESDPGKVKAELYDLVLNGVELGSGSIRINTAKLQSEVLKVINMSMDDARNKFGFLLDTFEHGAPPHGGIALGFDRLVSVLLGEKDIRGIIAFPKNKQAENPLDGSPSDWEPNQLNELHLKLK